MNDNDSLRQAKRDAATVRRQRELLKRAHVVLALLVETVSREGGHDSGPLFELFEDVEIELAARQGDGRRRGGGGAGKPALK